jgi:alpha-1,3-rhamnosyl/mannosyltransferase
MVYPSLYEGFGLPVLEAMASGTPVLTSNIPVMREVAGDAAVFVDPYDVSDIARGLHRGIVDAQLRKDLAGKGLERAKLFDWTTHAQETLDYYRMVYEKSRRGSNRCWA